jgi:hypothetical protein
MLVELFFGGLLVWLPFAFSGSVLLLIIIRCLPKGCRYLPGLKKLSWLYFIWLLIGATLFFDLFLSILQYFVWQNSEFSRFVLPPYQSWGYFLRYILMKFWVADILVFLPALVFYAVLSLFKKYRNEIITKEDLSLTLLLCLLVGWPQTIIFIFLFLILTVLFTSINIILFKRKNINLLPPLLASALIVFIFGNFLISTLGISALVM